MPLAETDIEYLRDIVATSSGHVISPNQGYLFESRLKPVAEKSGLGSVLDLVNAMREHGRQVVFDQIAEAMTINETFFFRDMYPFDALRKHMLPELIASRKQKRQLTIWCAACSSGQEPYSVAITVREHFPELENWKVKILATDLSDEILEKGRDGTYSQFEVNRGLPAKLLVKYFEREGTVWRANDRLRSMIEFRKINLSKPWPAIPRCDIVFLRNVLIYFEAVTKESILNRVRRTMEDDGYLILGGGETLINLHHAPFEREAIGNAVAYRPAQQKDRK